MDILMIIVVVAAYFAVLGFGIACAWWMHRRAVARARRIDDRRAAGLSQAR
jgi:hypothetical protein